MAVVGWSSGAANINGRFLPIEEAAIPTTDWGCRRSNATYDVVAVWRGAFFRLDDHLKRFRNSMRALRLDPPETDDTIRRVLAECVRRSGLREAYIAMDCLRSSPMPGQARHPASCRNLTAFVIPWLWVVSPDVQARGAHLAVAKTPRIADASVDPRVKNFHWGDFTRGLFEAYDHGADNGVLLDSDGNATEGPRGALEGITRLSSRNLQRFRDFIHGPRPAGARAMGGRRNFPGDDGRWHHTGWAPRRAYPWRRPGRGPSPRAYARHSGRSVPKGGTQLPSTMRHERPMH
jgi:hypothetical protein